MTKALAACVSVLLCAVISFAEPSATMSPLRDLPPEMQTKMAQLAQIIAGAM